MFPLVREKFWNELSEFNNEYCFLVCDLLWYTSRNCFDLLFAFQSVCLLDRHVSSVVYYQLFALYLSQLLGLYNLKQFFFINFWIYIILIAFCSNLFSISARFTSFKQIKSWCVCVWESICACVCIFRTMYIENFHKYKLFYYCYITWK